jgi:hypothetical protein
MLLLSLLPRESGISLANETSGEYSMHPIMLDRNKTLSVLYYSCGGFGAFNEHET